MKDFLARPCTAFAGMKRIAHGSLVDTALAVKAAEADLEDARILVFDDATGRVVDLDLRGGRAEIVDRLTARARNLAAPQENGPGKKRASGQGRGRPKLGVVAREVTLLPRHWDWLARQRGGASATLRRLVDQARHADEGGTVSRSAKEAAYHFMSAMAGDLPHFEDAIRALYADDRLEFEARMADWPKDVRDYTSRLAAGTAIEAGGERQ